MVTSGCSTEADLTDVLVGKQNRKTNSECDSITLIVAPNGPADPIEQCRLLEAKQKTSVKRRETGKE